MTIRIPKWAIGVAILAAVAVAAFLIGRDTSPVDESSTAADSPGASTKIPCGGDQGLRALSSGEGERFLRQWFTVPYGTEISEFFSVGRIECLDLSGDGSREMVLQLVAGASGGATPWAIFEAGNGVWAPVFLRNGPGRELVVSVSEDGIRNKSPTYAVGDPLCCPTGYRRGFVRFADGGYHYWPDTGTRARTVDVPPDGSSLLAGIDLWTLKPHVATQEFGLPSSVSHDNEICDTWWADIGLRINFVNLGGDNPCSAKGAVGSVDLEGPAAQQAGWRTTEGLEVGMPIERMLRLYPKAQTSQYLAPQPEFGIRGRGYAVKTKPSVIGDGVSAPSLIARIEAGTVVAIQLPIGAGGE